jgi:dipeptidyl aminopeptidase/acylaminoacyl peptidase
MLVKYLVAAGALSGFAVLSAPLQQAPPATEIYLMAMPGAQRPDLVRWANISNNAGYDNQPSFLPDGSGLLFSSMRDGKQTDIYRYDIAGERVTQATNTPESEYSPTVTPDKRGFSAVRVEADNAQRLWRFDLDGSHPRVVLENVKPVGYHVWIDETHLALFVLGANGGPATLQLADTTTGAATVAVTGIGRSLLMRPGTSTVSYLATGETPPVLKALDPRTGVSTTLIAPVEGSQDCAWLPDGRLIMARGRVISVWAAGTTTWEPFVEFPTAASGQTPPGTAGMLPGFDAITRLAVSPDGRWLAFVANPRQP